MTNPDEYFCSAKVSRASLATIMTLLLLTMNATSLAQHHAAKLTVAATPPMGWNSWDAFSRTLNEDKIKETAKWISAHLKRYGWEYVVVDEGWYLKNLSANGADENPQFELDDFGRYVPVPSRFPSAGRNRTFKPLADYLHSLGLKFGIHIIRGIPREAVEKNLPIAGSKFHAADAAEVSDVCPWNKYNYGLKPNSPASQAYYDSLAELYAKWGVDFVKVDCIADHPYKGNEIRMFSNSIAKSGRRMVLSLSPGPTSIDKRDEVAKYSQMWRISDDVWDVWSSATDFPQGVKNQFTKAALWAGIGKAGHWPDADMLPIGSLRPAPGWGDARETRLSQDEQRTMFSLWSIFRSPLIMGGNLLLSDPWTLSLLSNAEVLAVDQHSRDNRPVLNSDDIVVWTAKPQSGAGVYVAVFNLNDAPKVVDYKWREIGFSSAGHEVRDLWKRKSLGRANTLKVSLPAHGCILYRVY